MYHNSFRRRIVVNHWILWLNIINIIFKKVFRHREIVHVIKHVGITVRHMKRVHMTIVHRIGELRKLRTILRIFLFRINHFFFSSLLRPDEFSNLIRTITLFRLNCLHNHFFWRTNTSTYLLLLHLVREYGIILVPICNLWHIQLLWHVLLKHLAYPFCNFVFYYLC